MNYSRNVIVFPIVSLNVIKVMFSVKKLGRLTHYIISLADKHRVILSPKRKIPKERGKIKTRYSMKEKL